MIFTKGATDRMRYSQYYYYYYRFAFPGKDRRLCP